MPPDPDTSTGSLTINRHEAVTELVLNRPAEHNCLTVDLVERLQETFERIENDDTTKVIVISANGPSYCGGYDFNEFLARESATEQRAAYLSCNDMMLRIAASSKATIAAVQGLVAGSGLEIVGSCDLAIATDNARFCTPGIRMGLWDHSAQVTLSRQTTRKQAMEMLLTGTEIDAETALRMGLVNRVVAVGQLRPMVMALAQTIAEKSLHCISLGKYSYDHQAAMGAEQAYEFVSDQYFRDVQSADAVEGVAAAVEGRPPIWKGR